MPEQLKLDKHVGRLRWHQQQQKWRVLTVIMNKCANALALRRLRAPSGGSSPSSIWAAWNLRRRLIGVVGAATMAIAAVASPVSASPMFAYPWPDYSVVPILFSPTDWNVSSAEVQNEAAALRTALTEIQDFYRIAMGGRTFSLNDLQVVQGNNPRESYGIVWNGRNIYTDGIDIVGNVEEAVVGELHSRGYPTPPRQNEDGYVALIFMKGAGGWAGGRELGAGDGGWAILGDWAIDSIQGQVPTGAYWWSGRSLQVGAAAHELGHTFGLPHPDAYGGNWATTVMGEWWRYPNLGLNAWEVDRLVSTKANFFPESTPVPEPSTLVLLSVGVVFVQRVRKKRGATRERWSRGSARCTPRRWPAR